MLYAATSLKSNFGKSSTNSSIFAVPENLISYFGYKNSAHCINRLYYSTRSWEDAIYAELWAGCPVPYSGSKVSTGHAFVCDGYDGMGRFHINWGWNGRSNGYFLLNLLNPEDASRGSVDGAYSYVYGQTAVIGVMPDNVSGEATPSLVFQQLIIKSSVTSRYYDSRDFSVTLSGMFVNNTYVTSQFQLAWGLYDLNGNLIKVVYRRDTPVTLGYGEMFNDTLMELKFGAGISSGTYLLKPIYAVSLVEDNYLPCIGAEMSYLEVTINGNSCTIKGYGVAESTGKYTVNGCIATGTYNHGKPLIIKLTLTNTGVTCNDMVYMHVNGSFAAAALSDIAPGKSGYVIFRYTPNSAGDKTLTFSLKQSGSPILYTKNVTIDTMPSAKLDVSYRFLNVSDEENRVITADRISIIADVTNNGTETYNEDFMVRLFRLSNNNTNAASEVQSLMKSLNLAPGATKSLQFDFDHDLVDGWRYYCMLSYYSNGTTVNKSTNRYSLNLTDDPMSLNRYSVIINAVPSQAGGAQLSGHVLVNGKVDAGETVFVTPLPNAGWLFNDMVVTDSLGNSVDVVAANVGTYAFDMPESDVNLTVHFRSMPRVTTIVEPSDGGSIQLSGPFVVDDKIMAGETVTVTPVPVSGWACSWVTVIDSVGNPVEVNEAADGTYTFVIPDSDVTVTAFFEPMPRVTVHLNPSYAGDVLLSGRIQEDDKFRIGDPVTITPQPNLGWQLCDVAVVDSMGNPVEVIKQDGGTYSFVMPRSDVSMSASFERSTGNLFEVVRGYTDIIADETYILVSRSCDKVMKHWCDADTTLQSHDIVEWLDEDQDVVRVDDAACFFTMSQIADTTIRGKQQVFKAAYMTTGNQYVSSSSNSANVLMSNNKSRGRIWLWLFTMPGDNIPYSLIYFSSYDSRYGIGYDHVTGGFKMTYITVSDPNPIYLFLYKLVKAYRLTTAFDSSRGSVAVTGGMVNQTVQRGETVTFTVTPVQGYTTAAVQVTTTGNETVATTYDEASGTYSFIMPGKNVTIQASFEEYAGPGYLMGDVDHDGIVGINDLTVLIDYILGMVDDIDLSVADLNQDGLIGITDAAELIDIILLDDAAPSAQ